jgi:hypothetical protein
MNTLTPIHLALDDSLGESVDLIEARTDAAISRLDEMVAVAEFRQSARTAAVTFMLAGFRALQANDAITELFFSLNPAGRPRAQVIESRRQWRERRYGRSFS